MTWRRIFYRMEYSMARTPSKMGRRGGALEKSLRILVSEEDCAMGDLFPNMLERGQYALRS